MLPNYDLSNQTPITIESLKAVGFNRVITDRGFDVLQWGEDEGNHLLIVFTNGIIESITAFYIFKLGKTEEVNQFEAIGPDKLSKCTVETLLWLVDVFLSEE